MDVHYPVALESATPESILSIFQDHHRQSCQCDEADPDVVLSFQTTVGEWRVACDLLDWRALGRALNKEFDIAASKAEWRAALEPSHQRSLKEVCELIARHALVPRIRPSYLTGRPCVPAGAFLTVRSILNDAGVDAARIAPSTPLAEYCRRHMEIFLGPISRLAPGRLPPVKIETPIYDAANWLMLVGMVFLLFGVIAQQADAPEATIVAVMIFVACWVFQWIAACIPPASVQVGELKTFRDLSYVLAGAPPRTRD